MTELRRDPDERKTERASDERQGPRVRAYRVEVTEGAAKGSKAVSRDGELSVGAAPGNDLVVEDARVSSHHLELEAFEGGVQLRDLGSTNGTDVDGYRTTGIVLRGQARITIGNTQLWYTEEGQGPALPVSQHTSFGNAIGVSQAMRRIFSILERIAPTEATVLLEGESGTGKEVLARAIHESSGRRTKPYVVMDCSATTASLLESELFGHARGAFTGAVKERAGMAETANGGTLFLDEIGEMPIDLQTRLLGLLERRTIRRVGASDERPVDIRVIAATNRDLRREVNEGHFRADLWHRLAVVRVNIPPLRQRPEDIVPIARRIVADLQKRYKIPAGAAPITDDLLLKLTRHRWSGNVRELRNHLERTIAMAASGGGDVDLGVEPDAAPSDHGSTDLTGAFKDAKLRHMSLFEKAYLGALLQRHKGNLSAAAREAGLSRLHLRMLARRYGIAAGSDKD